MNPLILVFVGIKAKGQISKRVFHENKARQIFRKRNISYPLIRTRIRFCIRFSIILGMSLNQKLVILQQKYI